MSRWIRQHEIDKGGREGLTTEEHWELSRLRREARTLRHEREILKKAEKVLSRILSEGGRRSVNSCYAFTEAEKTGGFSVHVPDVGRFQKRLLRLDRQATFGKASRGWRSNRGDPRDPRAQQADLRFSEGSHAKLRALGTRCSRKRVERLMCGRRRRTTRWS